MTEPRSQRMAEVLNQFRLTPLRQCRPIPDPEVFQGIFAVASSKRPAAA